MYTFYGSYELKAWLEKVFEEYCIRKYGKSIINPKLVKKVKLVKQVQGKIPFYKILNKQKQSYDSSRNKSFRRLSKRLKNWKSRR